MKNLLRKLYVSYAATAARSFITPKNIFLLLIGLLVGLCFSFSLDFNLSRDYRNWNWNSEPKESHSTNTVGLSNDIGQYDEAHTEEIRTVADQLYNNTKVLCWIMTSPSNHKTKAKSVIETWGKRCNKLLIMSSAKDDKIDTIALPVEEGRNGLWGKTREAFKYIYENHLNEYDWFLKADDDTYTIVENLRYLLYPYSPETPIYFGCRFNPYVKQGYMSGGAGYVLSREAVRRFVEVAMPDGSKCREDGGGAEDVEIGKCLENVEVSAGDSRDSAGRGRFFAFVPENHLRPFHKENDDFWYWKNIFYPTDEGLNACSDYTITFHYTTPNQMHVLDYLIYHLQPYGIVRYSPSLPHKLPFGYHTSDDRKKS